MTARPDAIQSVLPAGVFRPAHARIAAGQALLDYVVEAEGVAETEGDPRCWPRRVFPSRASRKPIAELSHGERSRLIFLRMRLLQPNFYLLDEPTNHLDIEGQEDLEKQLEEATCPACSSATTAIFTRTAATRFLEIRKGRLVEIEDPDAFFDAQA